MKKKRVEIDWKETKKNDEREREREREQQQLQQLLWTYRGHYNQQGKEP